MKAQRRHDLQANSLADNLVEAVEYIKSQSQTIITAAVAVVVVVGVIWYWQYTTAMNRARGWQEMLSLVNTTKQQDPQYLDKLQQLAESQSNSELRSMAYCQLGNELLGQATYVALPADKAAEYRQRAQQAFTNALNNAGSESLTAGISHLGLATIAADANDASTARQHYEAVLNNPSLKGTSYLTQATGQLTALDAAAKLPPLAISTQPAAAASAPASQAG